MRAKLFISFLACIGTFWSLPASADDFLADRHGQIGIKCEQCHGTDAKKPEMPSIDTCVKCHPTNALVDMTKNVKPKNPHTSPHYTPQSLRSSLRNFRTHQSVQTALPRIFGSISKTHAACTAA